MFLLAIQNAIKCEVSKGSSSRYVFVTYKLLVDGAHKSTDGFCYIASSIIACSELSIHVPKSNAADTLISQLPFFCYKEKNKIKLVQ